MSDRQRLVILGSTGSIGTQALEVVAAHPDRFEVIGLGAGRNATLLAEQALRFQPRVVALADAGGAEELTRLLTETGIQVRGGAEALEELAQHPDAGMVLLALLGIAGLRPALAAARAGKTLALANKEALVVGGPVLTRAVREHGATLVPVDSEHSGIFQCLHGHDRSGVRRIVLTASGGPFLGVPRDRLERVTPAEALAHPTWTMGNKITVDCATLFNKGLECIEAHWLFGLPYERVQVVVHPQSIVHGLVHFEDGAAIAQLGVPDMRLPIQYALSHPRRWPAPWPQLDLATAPALTFHSLEAGEFPCFDLAREAGHRGGTAPAVLNGADEAAVAAFLDGRIGFLDIERALERALAQHRVIADPTLDDLLAADREGRAVLRSTGVVAV